MAHHHGGASAAPVLPGSRVFALVGSPNSGKTTLFNALTGMRAKTGNYPGVTVARYEGVSRVGGVDVGVEDLPGTYSLEPISPDEQIVAAVLDPDDAANRTPDAVLVTLDSTTLRRSAVLLAQVLARGLPVCVVLTFTDELTRRSGRLDVEAFARAIGTPVVSVVAGSRAGVDRLREVMADPAGWSRPPLPPPTDPDSLTGWVDSVLDAARYECPLADPRTRAVDRVMLHPVWGTLVFFATMYAFFQTIFTVAAPAQSAIESAFTSLAGFVTDHVHPDWLAGLLGGGVIGGVGTVVTFLPQIALLFLLISLLEQVGYLSRAAFLMDRLMARAGLEGRAFVALLSSMACAIPGIMATRSLPSARHRLATMMSAPLMTCSARLPVYVLLVGLLVSPDARWGPFGAQGTVMFGLYLLGAVSAMTAAWVFSWFGDRRGGAMPFYMEMPPYRLPSVRSVALSVWEACAAFLRKVTRIILVTTIVLWLLLNLPARGEADLAAAGVDTSSPTAVSAYVLDHSYAASVGKAVEPAFAPQGFDWRIDIGIIASLSARETFVSTLGQVAAATDPEDPTQALRSMTVQDGPQAGQPLFTPPVVAAMLAFFVYALQCMSTVAVLRRETGTWRWPAIAFTYMFALAWVMSAFVAWLVGRVT